jgi:hypothetical protein
VPQPAAATQIATGRAKRLTGDSLARRAGGGPDGPLTAWDCRWIPGVMPAGARRATVCP